MSINIEYPHIIQYDECLKVKSPLSGRKILKKYSWGLTDTPFREAFVVGIVTSAYFNLTSLGV